MNDLPWLRASRPPCSNSSGNSRGREESRKQSPLQDLQQSWKTNFWTNWQPITPLGICHWLHGIWKLRKVTNDKKAAYEARGWLFNDTTLEDLKGEKRSICEDKDITRGWDFARRTWFEQPLVYQKENQVLFYSYHSMILSYSYYSLFYMFICSCPF